MSLDTYYTIRVTVDAEHADRLKHRLCEALGNDGDFDLEAPAKSRPVVITVTHSRNLGASTSARYEKSVEEILQSAAEAFPDAVIEVLWKNEYEQEGRMEFHAIREGEAAGNSDRLAPTFIDQDIARRFMEDPNSFNLTRAVGMSDAAAQILADYTGDLNLTEVQELSESAVKILSKHKGDLCLGQVQLSLESAEALSNHGGFLDLGISELSPAVAKALSKHQGTLSLSMLPELPADSAAILAEHRGELSFEDVPGLTDSAAIALSKHRGPLRLDGIAEVSDSVAQALSRHQDEVDLYGLVSLSIDAARAFLRHGNVNTQIDLEELANGQS